MMNNNQMFKRLAVIFCVALLSACAASGGGSPSNAESRTRSDVCKSGDIEITSRSQCLLDDAACYQLNDGGWCTGERGNSCPSGSKPLSAGSQCPAGARCFALAESLNCYIGG